MTKPTPKADVVRLAYSTADAATAIPCSIATLYRGMSHKLIRFTKLGRVIRIPADEVERLVVEGLPPMSRGPYVRKTTGPTRRGRSAKAKPLRKTKGRHAERELRP